MTITKCPEHEVDLVRTIGKAWNVCPADDASFCLECGSPQPLTWMSGLCDQHYREQAARADALERRRIASYAGRQALRAAADELEGVALRVGPEWLRDFANRYEAASQ